MSILGRLMLSFGLLVSSPTLPTAYEMKRDSFELVDKGVIFPAWKSEEEVANQLVEISPPYWTPQSSDVAALETRLRDYLMSSDVGGAEYVGRRLSQYKRQYLGYSEGENRWILVNGFCADFWRTRDFWQERFVFVLDGGECFFRIRFLVRNGEFDRLEIDRRS